MERVVAIIDLKSFYASCECAARHLDPFRTPLVCCDPYRGDGTIVMSATPFLKAKYHIPNVCRRKDLPHVPGMIYAQPRMSYYLQMSARVISIFLDYVAEEDLHVYSVDESFLNLGPYQNLYPSPEALVATIQKRIHRELGLIATAGIGPNMFLAKIALDQEGKKKEPYLARWSYADVPTKLWSIEPMEKIWSIGNGTANHLRRIGVRNLKELAEAPLSFLTKEFGIMGEQLKNLANGIDNADIAASYTPEERSLTYGQTLMRDYQKEEAALLIREMGDELAYRLRSQGSLTGGVSLYVGHTNGYSFVRQRKLSYATDAPERLIAHLEELLREDIEDAPLRHLSISFYHLEETRYIQIDLLDGADGDQKQERMLSALDEIRSCYGANAVLRCSALCAHSTIRDRHEQIGGHKR